jgi:predicted Zn-dependent protease
MARRLLPWLFAALLAAGLVWAWLVGPWHARPRDDPRARSIHTLLAQNDLAAAEKNLGDWLSEEPRSATAWELRALLDLQRGDSTKALASIDKARTLGLDRPRAEALRAVWLERSGRSAEAQPLLAKILEDDPKPVPQVHEALARILLGTYQLRLASIVLDRWTRDYPDDPRPYLLMTEIDQRTDLGTDAAVSHFQAALERAPGLIAARRGLAQALRAASRHDEALAAYDRLLDETPGDVESRLGRARTLSSLGLHDRAAADLDPVLTEQPENAEVLRLRASIDLARGEVEPALGRLERSLDLAPFDAESHYLHAQALERLGRIDQARTARERAAALRDDEEALRKVQQEFNRNPNNDALRCQIARWMIEHGQGPQGVRWIMTILSRNPKHPEANRLLADYYESTGQSGLANFHRLQAGEPAPARQAPPPASHPEGS